MCNGRIPYSRLLNLYIKHMVLQPPTVPKRRSNVHLQRAQITIRHHGAVPQHMHRLSMVPVPGMYRREHRRSTAISTPRSTAISTTISTPDPHPVLHPEHEGVAGSSGGKPRLGPRSVPADRPGVVPLVGYLGQPNIVREPPSPVLAQIQGHIVRVVSIGIPAHIIVPNAPLGTRGGAGYCRCPRGRLRRWRPRSRRR